jgi:hypothetical protein
MTGRFFQSLPTQTDTTTVAFIYKIGNHNLERKKNEIFFKKNKFPPFFTSLHFALDNWIGRTRFKTGCYFICENRYV